jgi:ribonuclease HI
MKIKVYTDGSAHQNIVAAYGVVVVRQLSDTVVQVTEFGGVVDPKYPSTSNSAELLAVSVALEKLLTDQKFAYDSISSVVVYTDSELVLRWLDGTYKINKPHIQELVDGIKYRCKMLKVPITFEKVLAHSGNVYNEWADKVAKEYLNKC